MSRDKRNTILVKDDPFSDRPPRILHHEGVPLVSELVDMADFDELDRELVRVFIDGEEVPAELWTHREGLGHVEIMVAPLGGEGDKILRTVLTIAVVVAAFYFGGTVGGFLGLSGEAAAAVGGAIITTAGQLAINAILPPPVLSGMYADEPDPVYFIEGARNQLALNQPIQTVLGRHRVMPRLAARAWPEIRGDDSYFYVILDLGPAGITVSDIKVGDTPIANLDGVEYQLKLDVGDPHPAMASRQTIPEQVGAVLGAGDWEGRRTASDAVDCDLILLFPVGLGKVNDKGKPRSHSTSVRVRYREVFNPGPGETFGPWSFADSPAPGGIPFRGFFGTFVEVTPNYQGGDAGLFQFVESKPGQPFYRQIGFSFPHAATWEVEVQRVGADGEITDKIYDDMRLETVLSKRDEAPIQRDDVAYGVFRFKATDETSGAIDTINMVIERKAPVFPDAVLDQSDLTGVTASSLAAAAGTSNPWEIILWIARNPFLARRAYSDSEINWPSFAAAAKDARDRGKRFDFVVSRDLDSDALIDLAAFAGEGRVYRFNGLMTAHVDGPQAAPTHFFREGTARNISAQITFPQEVHGYRVTFNDEQDGFRQREVIVYVDGYTKETATRIEPFTMAGKVDWTDLHEALQQQFRNSRQQTETMTLEVPADRVDNTLKPMVWVSVATRVLAQARDSGVIRELATNGSGDVTGLTLDQPVFQGPSYGALSLKWVRQSETSTAVMSSDVFAMVTPGVDARSVTVTFDTPLAGADKPQAGDEFIIGPSGVDLYDGLLDFAEPAGEGWLRLHLKEYAPDRFDDTGFSVPTYAPVYDLPVNPAPPQPVLEVVTADERQIMVVFSLPDGYAARISHFRVWRADAPEAGDPNPGALGLFIPLPDLAPAERRVIDTARTAGDRVIYRIQAMSETGRGGPVLETPVINSADNIGQPQAVAVTPGTDAVSGGASKPLLTVTFTPDERDTLLDAVVAIREVALDGVGARLAEGSQPAFDQGFIVDPASGRGVIRGVTAGRTYDVEVYFRGRRGERGTPVRVTDVVAPETDVAFSALTAEEAAGIKVGSNLDTIFTQLDAKAQQALDTGTAADSKAGQAITTADGAASVAQAASTKADDAESTAASAVSTANNAASVASAAQSTANGAQSTATSALAASTANGNAVADFQAVAAVGGFSGSLHPNPYFNFWPDGAARPDGYTGAVGGNPTRVAGDLVGRWKMRLPGPASGNGYVYTSEGKAGPGKYVVRATVELVSGSYVGAGVLVRFRNASNVIVADRLLTFSTDTDTAGSVGSAVSGVRHFEKEVIAPAGTTKREIFTMSHWTGLGAITAANSLDWHMADLLPQPHGSAQSALALSATQNIEGRLAAGFSLTTDVNGRITGVKGLDNGVVGQLILLADETLIYDGVTDRALFEAGYGIVRVNGDLAVGGSILVGAVRQRVALQPLTYQVADGQSVTFPGNFGHNPVVKFFSDGLDPLDAGETYELKALNLSGTGFTAQLRIKVPGGTTQVNSFGDFAGSGSNPDRMMHKSDAADAYNGNYTFNFNGSVQARHFGDGETFIIEGTVDLMIHNGSGWQVVGTYNIVESDINDPAWNPGGPLQNGMFTFAASVPAYFGGAIGQHAGAEFGLDIDSGTITGLDVTSITYLKQTGSTYASASPNGETCRVEVQPNNQ